MSNISQLRQTSERVPVATYDVVYVDSSTEEVVTRQVEGMLYSMGEFMLIHNLQGVPMFVLPNNSIVSIEAQTIRMVDPKSIETEGTDGETTVH